MNTAKPAAASASTPASAGDTTAQIGGHIKPENERAACIHAARVYLRESSARTSKSRSFSFVLFAWAQRARREAASAIKAPPQMTLF